jgi:geranyl-CoA carboxylase alpha subunit
MTPEGAQMFHKILIANRGEIACRIIRTARRMGIATAAVYSEADVDALHVSLADESHCIGPASPRASYLNIEAVLNAARKLGAEAIHPGYGFLSENADFAQACADAGIIFIGPPPAAMRAVGDKGLAKRLMREAGVPCIPGYDGEDQTDAALGTAAAEIGFPVMIKAASGGGGRGMRLVAHGVAFPEALRSARSEAQAAFGSGVLLLERAIRSARHVEVQVFADTHGNVIHLGERDCSVQRRHQKLIEEAPAPGLPEALRARIGQAAVAAARAAGYVGAGTVEFLLDAADGAYWFMEMNARLQVEHPVTEAITGIDLVEWQIRVARGEPLPRKQEEIQFAGHAIEARLCAEDPERDFLPASGPVRAWLAPPGVRTDHGLREVDDVPAHYDSMLAKLVAWGDTRAAAREKLADALRQTVLLGVASNRGLLLRCLQHPEFTAGGVTTGFIDQLGVSGADRDAARLALAAALLHECAHPWRGPEEWFNWRSTTAPARSMRLESSDEMLAAELEPVGRHAYRVTVDGVRTAVHLHARKAARVDAEMDGVRRSYAFVIHGATVEIALPTGDLVVRDATGDRIRSGGSGASDGSVRSPMNGRVVALHVSVGQTVVGGEVLLVLEAMKMEHPITAPIAGRIAEVLVVRDSQVGPAALLARIEPVG